MVDPYVLLRVLDAGDGLDSRLLLLGRLRRVVLPLLEGSQVVWSSGVGVREARAAEPRHRGRASCLEVALPTLRCALRVHPSMHRECRDGPQCAIPYVNSNHHKILMFTMS